MVDDQAARLVTYEVILSNLGVRCVRALSATEALEHLLKDEFAVILLDVHMPGMDGFELARLIRDHPRVQHTPIIFITGVHVSEMDTLRGYQSGAVDYISVPVVPEILRGKVAVLVELHQKRRELQHINERLAEARSRLEAEHVAAMAQKDAQLRAVFEHPSELTVVLRAERDAGGEVTGWIYRDANVNALELLGCTRETLLGRSHADVFRERAVLPHERCVRVLLTGTPERYESRYGDREFLITIYPIGDDCVVSSGVDITERKHVEAALRDRERALKDADRRKDEFLAMLAHELRNPVAPISNAADVLSRLLADRQREGVLVEIVRRQAAHLSRLLDDLLDVARITQGHIDLKRSVVPLADCIQQAIETAEPLVREKGHQLLVSEPYPPLHVNADRVRLAQSIANILLNAAKYTNGGGEIRITSYADAGEAVIEITDTGSGITSDLLPKVFDLFVQSQRSLDRTLGGLGIGLAVCKQLVEMHGGTVAASSPGLGAGATFTIRLPLADPMAAMPPERRDARAAPQHVLVVDDNRDSADSLALLLELEGHKTRAVYSAQAALEHVASFQPDVVLLDIGLPEMDGYEVARLIRQYAQVPRLVAVSGYGQPEERRRSSAAGFTAHLVKPVDVAALKKALSV
jgi:signal transduction histidine kinase